MAYTHTSFAQARAALKARLQDSANVFWPDAELGLYVVEALRTWGALTAYWHDRGSFNTTAGTAFYDLPTRIAALRGYNVTGQQVVTEIEYHLLEPPTTPAWSGTLQFTMPELTGAIERRRNQFLVDTGCVITPSAPAGAPTAPGRFLLPDNVMDIRRTSWTDTEGVVTNLWRDDEFEFGAISPGWTGAPATPEAYSVAVTPPLTLQLMPPPSDVGTVAILAVESGATVDVTGTVLGIPDDLSWGVKFGALADLLGKDGPAHDAVRAQYSEQRYREAVELAKIYPSVINAALNGRDLAVESLANVDGFRPTWQSVPNPPDLIATAGLNLIALVNVPDGVYSATLDVVSNAPIPAVDGDFLQIGREELDVILDYAQHLACFKLGGAEFLATMELYKRFIQLAAVKNARYRASVIYAKAMRELAWLEEKYRPRVEEPVHG